MVTFRGAVTVFCSLMLSCSNEQTSPGGLSEAGGDAAEGSSDANSELPTIARGAVHATLEKGRNPGLCPGGYGWLEIGSRERLVADLEEVNGSVVRVTCNVSPEGDAFRVSGTVSTSESGASFSIDATLSPVGEQVGVTGLFSKDGVTYRGLDCTVDYTRQSMGVSEVRASGVIICPKAEAVDGSIACQIKAEFSFDRCGTEK